MSFAQIIAPTLALLDEGREEWHPRLFLTLRRLEEDEGLTSGSREKKLQAACDRFFGRHLLRNDVA